MSNVNLLILDMHRMKILGQDFNDTADTFEAIVKFASENNMDYGPPREVYTNTATNKETIVGDMIRNGETVATYQINH